VFADKPVAVQVGEVRTFNGAPTHVINVDGAAAVVDEKTIHDANDALAP
jgi:hypothetical protein